jgi:hypothetical protein
VKSILLQVLAVRHKEMRILASDSAVWN